MTHLLNNNYLTVDDVLLVPTYGRLRSRSDAELKPFIYSAPMDRVTGYALTNAMLQLGQIPVVSRFLPEEERIACIRSYHDTEAFFTVGGTIEALKGFLEELKKAELTECKINVAIDIAHGWSMQGVWALKWLRNQPFVKNIMSGSIATGEAAQSCIKFGATHLRTGIGPGSQCLTRIKTGVGIPNLSAVYQVAQAAAGKAVVIADGGIKEPGDAAKYLAAGANGVMLGSVLSRTFESAGWTITYEDDDLYLDGKQVMLPNWTDPKPIYTKTYRGQASKEFQLDEKGKASACPEGAASASFQWDRTTTVKTVVEEFQGGIASAISYTGGSSIDDLNPESVAMIQVTTNGHREGTDHGNG